MTLFGLQRKAGKTLKAKQAHSYVQALEQMCNFMIVDGEPSKDRQKLLRNLRVFFLYSHLLNQLYIFAII